MGYADSNENKSEMILAAFAIFTMPSFSSTWNDNNYQDRFEIIWKLIEQGL